MPLLGFTVFKEKILNGTKTQTIRKLRKHPIKKGDKLYLYWKLRTKQCEKLGEAICTDAFEISVGCANEWAIFIGRDYARELGIVSIERRLTNYDIHEIVCRDGFENNEDFLKFFESHYGYLPQVFQVIRWELLEAKK